MCILAQCINKNHKLNRDFIKAMNEDIICFNIYKESLAKEMGKYLESLNNKGKICLWGAAAKEVTSVAILIERRL
jgi:hypothetical protein